MQIELKNIVKEYKQRQTSHSLFESAATIFHPRFEIFRAVNDISFSITKGEAIGYIGPNGSGKSTTIKMLCGILTPTKGQILIDGIPFTTQKRTDFNKKIGVVFGNRSMLWWDVPVIESYRVLKTLYNLPDNVFQKNLSEFIDILDLEPLLNLPERQLSLGQKMKCNIAAAFLHNPEIVFLDEPTIGLDTTSKTKIRNFIQYINQQRKTTFVITSHDFQDIESLCKRIILINHGEIIIDDEISQVKHDFSSKKQIQFEFENNPWYFNNNFLFPEVQTKMNTSTNLILEYDTNKVNYLDLIKYVTHHVEIKDISISGQNIESIIQQIIKNDEDYKAGMAL